MIQPIGDKVLIKILKETKTASGIILTDESNESRGEVIAMGAKTDKSEVHEGDKVLFEDLGGEKIKEGNEEYVLVTHREGCYKILAKV
jgi:chaperonin GroES